MHACCGPCLAAPYRHLQSEGMEMAVFWYNPNIHPFTEYKARKDSLLAFCKDSGIEIIVQDDYALESFLSQALMRGVERCESCYELRLRQCALRAAEAGFEAFSSTLLYSRYQNHDLICAIANKAAEDYGVQFYYQDFRIYWQEGIELSKELGMYRQKYCGCIFSERDRYLKIRTNR